MGNKYPKGAEWRKWDLHVHTPYSICQKYGEDNETTWERFITDLEELPKDFSVIGINDYLFLDGYQKLVDEQKTNNRLKNLIIFPVVEFRIEKFAGVDFGSYKRINLHVIFSNELSIETIQSQFLNTLEQSYTLESGDKWTRAITQKSVAELGAEIKSSVPKEKLPQYGSDLTEGFNNLNVKEEQIFKALDKDCFKDKYLIAIGKTEWSELKWTDASIATKKSIINSADIVFTSAETVETFLKSKEQLTKQKVNDLLFDCSDAHAFSDAKEKDRIGKCYTWLKADPNFEGLRQVINEPKERLYIGDKPPLLEKVETNRTKYIRELSVKKTPGYTGTHGTWFDNIEIPLNHELVAIIGNKGSGKSAIADIISLCSNYHDDKDFSFLTSEKFREKSGKIAKNFVATLTWESDKPYKMGLYDVPEDTEVLTVKYIPQGRFERLTNEISTVEDFQKEIESVVFSHIPESERLSAETFQELIYKKSSSVESELSTLKDDISDINKQIIALEKKASPSYRKELENKIEKKKEELSALVKPEEVSDPNDDPEKKEKSATINKKIDEIKGEIEDLETKISEAEAQKKQALDEQQTLTTVKSEIVQKQAELKKFKDGRKQELEGFNIDLEKLISLKVDYSEIDALIADKKDELKNAKILLGEETTEEGYVSLQGKLKEKQDTLKKETAKLNTEQKLFQDYLSNKAKWEQETAKITGSSDQSDTLEFYKAEVEYLINNFRSDLESKLNERKEKARTIFDKKQEVIAVYKDARERLNEIIKQNSKTLNDYRVDVDAFLTIKSDFSERFLNFIDKTKKGSFYSQEGAESQFKVLTSEVNFDEKEDVISFLDNIIEALKEDKREKQNGELRIVSDQVKNIAELYEHLFSLEFLENNYQLKQGDKSLEQLSPGERGALLLVFYLLLDKSDIPLIIDQPEDNLDNHSVAKVLVPFIKMAKKKRQIIMVTHNPNLAVVADAEQVIYVKLDKESNYKFSTVSGSIENREVNEKIVEVLEGTMPAFNTRKRKYYD